MKVFLKFLIVAIVCLVIFFFISTTNKPQSSQLQKPVITVINPLRGPQLGLEKANLLASLQGQWKATKDATISATWLWQYSALEDNQLTSFAKSEMKGQEFGIFLEIDRNFAAKSDVSYRGNGPWYFSDGLFLVSYDQAERKKLIDTIFTQFKKTFGYYPKSVGGWWVGAESLQYMHKNYGVISSLQVADQYDLDVYSVWGTPWSIPYLSSKENAAIPASFEKSSGIVIMQWAARDPTFGYGNSPDNSTYSMQDYALKKYDLSYIDYLFTIFLKDPNDQLVIGLEGGFPPEVYQGEYKEKLVKIKKLENQQKITVATASNFAEKFLIRKKTFGSTQYFLSKGFVSDDQSFWYNSENFRAAIEKKGENIFLVDIRNYTNIPHEDFTLLPNSQGYLRIASPAVIDSARNPSSKILLAKATDPLTIKEGNETISLVSGAKEIARFTTQSLDFPTVSRSFVFKERSFSINIFLIFFSVLVVYFGILFVTQKNKDKILFHFIILSTCLSIVRPFLSSGSLTDLTYIFDKKELFLAPIMGFLPFDLSWSFLIIFQLMPFILLLLLHFIFVIKKKIKNIFALCVFGYILLYSHVPTGVVTEFITQKKIVVISTVGLYLLIMIALCLVLFVKKKKKILVKTVLGFLLGFGLLLSTLLFSWQQIIITPFEKEGLQQVKDIQKEVYYVMPKVMPVYRTVTPLLQVDYKYGELVTGTHWQEVRRPEGKFLTFENLDKSIIFISRYLGAELYPEEIEKYKLKKIFDNTQIAIFSQ